MSLLDVPAFLVVPLRDGLVEALSAHGMREASASPDALVTLSFKAVYPHTDALSNDGFVDPLSVGGPRKFDARVTLDIRRASDGVELLRGALQREHTESVGSYDHEPARPAMRDAFEQLLKRFPRA
jgi:hypothetical protein